MRLLLVVTRIIIIAATSSSSVAVIVRKGVHDDFLDLPAQISRHQAACARLPRPPVTC